jgi:hypothetical protein
MRHHSVILVALVSSVLADVPARAQTTAVGPYYATPAWDQTLACSAPASCPRFVVLSNFNGEAVLDRETGLVWERSPDTTTQSWDQAQFHCITRLVSNRGGWRLPHIQELRSLLDPTAKFLPPGHPFSVAPPGYYYWSATHRDQLPSFAWASSLEGGYGALLKNGNFVPAWCVRGGQSADAQ